MPRDSALHRKLLGDRADWTLTDALLARIDFRLAGANWQRSGGKGQKPKPIDIPDGGRRSERAAKAPGVDVATRLRNLGLIPPEAGTGDA